MRRIFTMVMSLCVLSTTNVLAQQAVQDAEPQVAAAKPVAEFPFEEGAGNKLFLNVRVNESQLLWFVLDTGAPTTHIDYGQARKLGLALENERLQRTGAGAGQELRMASTRNVAFDVHGQEQTNQVVPVLELHHVAEMMGRRVDGLLGNDFIQRYVFEIDYRSKAIRLYDPPSFRYVGAGHAVSIDVSSGWPSVKARVSVGGSEFDCKFIVDTGANAALYLNQPIVAEQRLLEGDSKLVSGIVARGAGGDSRGAIDRIDFVQLGPLRVLKPVSILSQDTSGFFAGRRFNGIIGGELLRRCKVFFDFSRGQMILEPYGTRTPIQYDKSGLLIRAESPEFRRFEVVSVLASTPAAESGVRRGDIITQVDDTAAGSMTLAEILATLKQQPDGTRVRLTVRRGEDEIDATLRLRDYAN